MIQIKTTKLQERLWKHFLSLKYKNKSGRSNRLEQLVKLAILEIVADEAQKQIKQSETNKQNE